TLWFTLPLRWSLSTTDFQRATSPEQPAPSGRRKSDGVTLGGAALALGGGALALQPARAAARRASVSGAAQRIMGGTLLYRIDRASLASGPHGGQARQQVRSGHRAAGPGSCPRRGAAPRGYRAPRPRCP